MRIVAFGDLHGKVASIDPICARSEKADLTIVAGDITSFGSPGQAERIVARVRGHAMRVLAIAGNCDSRAISDRLDEMGVGIHAKGQVIQGIGFFGVGGSGNTPFNTPFELAEIETERALRLGLSEVSGVARRVLVSHAPPWGTGLDVVRSGQHAGNRAVRRFIEEEQPDLVLCGHIHESAGVDHLGATTIVNLGPARDGCYAIIDIGVEIAIRQLDSSSREPS